MIVKSGTSYYLEMDGCLWAITYEQYLTLCDFVRGRIDLGQVPERLLHYERQHELVPCPRCNGGYIRRDIAESAFLLEELHERLVHKKEV